MSKQTTKSEKITLASLKKQCELNYRNTERHLITLKEDAFNNELSSNQGFGAQDLKPVYLQLYAYLLTKYSHKLIVKYKGYKHVEIWTKV